MENIKHAQLRLKCSKLNSHLFDLHVMDSPACLCGHNVEDSVHFLLHCQLHANSRDKMLQTINDLLVDQNLNVNILLHGSEKLDFKINCDIFKAVHLFISESNRL